MSTPKKTERAAMKLADTTEARAQAAYRATYAAYADAEATTARAAYDVAWKAYVAACKTFAEAVTIPAATTRRAVRAANAWAAEAADAVAITTADLHAARIATRDADDAAVAAIAAAEAAYLAAAAADALKRE